MLTGVDSPHPERSVVDGSAVALELCRGQWLDLQMGWRTMTGDEILREEQLGRAAERKGLRLVKADDGKYKIETAGSALAGAHGGPPVDCPDLDAVEQFLFSPPAHSRPLRRDEDYENAITPHAPHDGDWSNLPDEDSK